VPAANDGDTLAALRLTHAVSRLCDGQLEKQQGLTGARTSWSPTLTSTDIVRMATMGAAQVLGLRDEIGSITPGKKADLVVNTAAPFGLGAASPVDFVLFQSTSRDSDRVDVNGRLVVAHGVPVGVDMYAVRSVLDADA
jgi:5-methylthioadenosine/S-adenosylhomocysteine deaminase